MVIAIIGMLTALVSVAATYSLSRAKRAQITLEIDSLGMGVQKYKNENGAFPTDFGAYDNTAANTLRQNLVVAHWRKVFPRASLIPQGSPPTPYGGLAAVIQNVMSTTNKYPANWGNINYLDQAEALVFWLGGIPAIPPSQGTGGPQQLYNTRKLLGWGGNPTNPLDFRSSTLPAMFDFQDSRLLDTDGDGWYEYYPPVSDMTSAAPYLYFDSGTYTKTTDVSQAAKLNPYPIPASTNTNPVVPAQWGSFLPVAKTLGDGNNANNIGWMNPEKFQIISGGLDNNFGYPFTQSALWLYVANGSPMGSLSPGMSVKFGISAATGGNATPTEVMDNLSDFNASTLQDAIP